MRRLASFVALFAAASAAAIAATLAPSAVVSSAATLDGKTVTVAGKVTGFKTSASPMGGTVAGFQLCDSKCIVVIDRTGKAEKDGAQATVTGTFHVSFKSPKKTFTNAVVISK